ncbi:MAG: hypothetical protein QME55_07700 [Brevundimonas sp.]|uniref:hypothetical protein n=1 Tax=Brevundimonas sp. TaxID=1871086 RepID=UPI00261E7506|nr:hypothetical protein [Brevundimonas sp.]MDI6624599.1 hypothetical protein [Brevundimonas sp.]MDQ7811762.1 hypothetical protein [Brevundimonas sp.]
MTKTKLNFWFMAAVGVLAGALLGWMLYLAVVEAASGGPVAIISNATVQHKVGELMIAVPLFLTALLSRTHPYRSVANGLMRAWPITIVGAALNLLAWINTMERAPWTELNRLWFAGLVVVGIVAAPLIASAMRRGVAQE